MTILAIEISSLFKKIIPNLETVAGEAYCKSDVSKIKLTFGPKLIRSPVGKVSKWLSSNTEFNDSIHSGSISPSPRINKIEANITTFY